MADDPEVVLALQAARQAKQAKLASQRATTTPISREKNEANAAAGEVLACQDDRRAALFGA